MKIVATKVAESGDEYKAVFKNVHGETPTSIVTLTVKAPPPPEITKQPLSVEKLEGEEAKFEAEASGSPTPTVQWWESTNHGATFTEVAGATTDTLKVPATKAAESGDEYKAVFKNVHGETPTSIVTLTVKARQAPIVTKQPSSAEVTEGEEVQFEAEASGVPTPSVQWEESKNKGVSFAPVSGGTSDALKVPATKVSESGNEYRATFSNGVAPSAVTSVVKLTVKAKAAEVAPTITMQPASETVLEGGEAKFEASASGSPAPTVQWQVSKNGGFSFAPIPGATSGTLRIASASFVENGDQFRAVFRNAGYAETSVATLTVIALVPSVGPQQTGPPGVGGVLHEQEGSPTATVASTSVTVTAAGAFAVKIGCSGANVKSCADMIMVRTVTAVSAGSKAKKAILTLATASSTIAGGQSKSVTLHLSGKGRTLLSHSHTLRVRVTISSHDPSGGSHTTTTVVTLHLAKAHHH
jgi:hypothetical protein